LAVRAVFVTIRFIGGAAGAFAVVIGTAMTVESSTSTGRSGLMALHFAGVRIRIVCSAMLVSLLSRHGANWREGWLASGMPSILRRRGRIRDLSADSSASDDVGSIARQGAWILLAAGGRERALGLRLRDHRDIPGRDSEENARGQLP
jgi:hypothetical protein